MRQLMIVALGLLVILAYACKAPENPPQTVKNVDLTKYTGKWYEIAAYPNKFEKGCSCTTAEYSLSDKGHIIVKNRCLKKDKGEWSETTGKAFPVKGSQNAKLKVQFFWPFKGDYWIIDLSPDYEWAVVSDPKREYLWILSREKEMPEETYQHILAKLQERGFDIKNLQKTLQNCEN
jgi:apolipoprotein D and lipocalin family protein